MYRSAALGGLWNDTEKMHSPILISKLAVHIEEQEEQTVPHLHDYSTCCRHVNSQVHQLPYMYSQHLAHFSIHTTLALQGLSIHGHSRCEQH